MSSEGTQVLLYRARQLVKQYRAKQLHTTAVYWADKAHCLSQGDPNDLATYVQALYDAREYQRACYILQNSPFLSRSSSLRYLAARCYSACEDWEEVLTLLTPPDVLPDHTPPITPTNATPPSEDIVISSLGGVESASLVLKGNAHEGLGDLPSAVECYKQALSCDVYCEEALNRLSQHHTLTEEQEVALMAALPFKTQCNDAEEEMLRYLYTHKMHHLNKDSASSAESASLVPLSSSADVLCGVADTHLQHLNVEGCYQLTFALLERDLYHDHTLLLHVACCVQKRKQEELFSLGQVLVGSAPRSSLSWYVVGCYYLTIDKHQNARKYLTKAITLEPNFGPAHIAFGLSFAAEGEHDQAISAFSSAVRTMKGSHLPLLFLGKEYQQTGVLTTSSRFLKSAFDLAPHNPLLLQEIGYIVASVGSYPKAERYFQQAVVQLQAMDPHHTLQCWEPLYNNLGHVLRKQLKFEEALQAHEKALQLDTANTNTLTAIAFVHLMMENYLGVVDYASRSLRLKRDDQFTLEVLHMAMREMSIQPFLEGTPDMGPINEGVGPEVTMVLRPHPPQDEETPMSID